MIAQFEKEDLEELMKVLENVQQSAACLTENGHRQEPIETIRLGLQSFHTTAAMLGLTAVEQSGVALQDFFTTRIFAAEAIDTGLVLSFISTIKAVLAEMKNSLNGNGEETFNVERIIEVLYAIPELSMQQEVAGELTEDELPSSFSPLSSLPPHEAGAGDACDEDPSAISETTGCSEPFDVTDLLRVTRSLGGELSIEPENGSTRSFQLSFPVSETNILKIQTLLSTCDLNMNFATKMTQQDSRVEKVLGVFQEFVSAFSAGEVRQAQDVLLLLADQQQQAGVYKEVGVLARQLHDSLKGFVDTLDPTLVDIVEDKIPDTGSRLEHILKLTENAANTTLDHVEVMQRRNQDQQTELVQLRDRMSSMKAVGDKAQRLLAEGQLSLNVLQDSLGQTSADLITVLTAQDYQDLTGQIILKIINLLKDLEFKLITVIRTFGVRAESAKEVVDDELYGPAHSGRTTSVHSQDDVDSLLAGFGF
jgi:chemotaxis protein CheZ